MGGQRWLATARKEREGAKGSLRRMQDSSFESDESGDKIDAGCWFNLVANRNGMVVGNWSDNNGESSLGTRIGLKLRLELIPVKPY